MRHCARLTSHFRQLSSTLTDADKVIKQSSLMLNAADQKVRSPTSKIVSNGFDIYHLQKVFESRMPRLYHKFYCT